jgi:hypothetical protein
MGTVSTTSSPPPSSPPAKHPSPLPPGGPKRYGPTDDLGTLNRLSDPLTLTAARAEIQTGTRINLDWPLDAQGATPIFARQPFTHHLYQKPPRIVHDDTWAFNPQASSQWDGLRHFAYQRDRRFYNGLTLDEIQAAGSTRGGVGAWARRGIVGRAVLLDYHAWRTARGWSHDAFATAGISAETLREVAREQGTEIRFGDVLLVRSGYRECPPFLFLVLCWKCSGYVFDRPSPFPFLFFSFLFLFGGDSRFQYLTHSSRSPRSPVDAYNQLSTAQKEALQAKSPPTFAGVEQSEDMMAWLWENFSACAGDHPSWEAWPSQQDYALHEVMLAGWGMPIGELWDLEELAAHCQAVGRWSFFLVSKPNYVPGGVASPPNALAIF